jgi:hypothetical protein
VVRLFLFEPHKGDHMQETHPLDSEAAQLFVDRIVEQANPYNSLELTNVNSQEITRQLLPQCQLVAGQLMRRYISQMDYSKIPATEQTEADMEKTQEMAIPGVEVLVKTVRLGADPRVVPFGEDPRNYQNKNPRQRFFLATVLD